MKKIVLAFFTICILSSSFGQSRKKDQEVDIIDHQVQLGESVRMISKKYLVDPAEIYKLNKFAVEGISQGMVLKIPVPRKEGSVPKEKNSNDEALTQNDNNKPQGYSNSKPISDTKPIAETKSEPIKTETEKESAKDNSKVVSKENNKEAKTLTSPASNDVKKIVITERKTEVDHKVVAKETLYSLSREFNVSVDEIKASNPEVVKSGLKIGQIVKIPTSKTVDIQQSTAPIEPQTPTTLAANSKTEKTQSETVTENTENKPAETIRHKVEPKETLYSLSRKYNLSVDEIKSQNEALLKNGLQIGQVLTIKTK